ncbi:MAG: type II toxin-antitoxin system RelE/ParE family toxin [Tepidisphaerales bacterium]
MATVKLAVEARRVFDGLPRVMQARIEEVLVRLSRWPAVRGAKPLRHSLTGQYRIRTGDYRVQFRVGGDTVFVEKVGHRDGFYD